jgi:hypothetical protein
MAWKMTSPTKVTNDIFDEVLGYTRAVDNPKRYSTTRRSRPIYEHAQDMLITGETAENDLTVDEVEDVLLNPENTTLVSRTSGRPITFGWTLTDRHIAVIWETVCDNPKMIRVRTAYEVEPKGRRA